MKKLKIALILLCGSLFGYQLSAMYTSNSFIPATPPAPPTDRPRTIAPPPLPAESPHTHATITSEPLPTIAPPRSAHSPSFHEEAAEDLEGIAVQHVDDIAPLLGAHEDGTFRSAHLPLPAPGSWFYVLDLRDRNLKSIPELHDITDIEKVEALLLSGNQITHLRKKHLASMPNLRILDLRGNKIQGKGVSFNALHGSPHLRYLDLSHNMMLYHPPGALFGVIEKGMTPKRNCPELRILLMSHNNLKFINRSFFRPLSALKYVDISHNNITKLNRYVFSEQKHPVMVQMHSNHASSDLLLEAVEPTTRIVAGPTVVEIKRALREALTITSGSVTNGDEAGVLTGLASGLVDNKMDMFEMRATKGYENTIIDGTQFTQVPYPSDTPRSIGGTPREDEDPIKDDAAWHTPRGEAMDDESFAHEGPTDFEPAHDPVYHDEPHDERPRPTRVTVPRLPLHRLPPRGMAATAA